jgi:predicted permease
MPPGVRRVRDEVDEELRFHIEQTVERLVGEGMSEPQARAEAARRFGSAERIGARTSREDQAWLRLSSVWDSLAQDVRFAGRMLRRSPIFAGVAVLTLGLGLGAATSIFSVVQAVLLEPPSFRVPDRLVHVWEENRDEGWSNGTLSPADFFDVRERVAALEGAAGYGTGIVTISGDDLAEAVRAGWVTGDFFDVLGVHPISGRGFLSTETWSDAAPTVVLSDELWARRWSRDPAIVGSTLLVDEVARRVVGVMPPRVHFPELSTDLWVPMQWSPEGPRQRWFRDERFVYVVARLREGVSIDVARDQLAASMRELASERPDTNRGVDAGLTPLRESLTGAARAPLLLLLGATGLLLLLTCANLANLLLVRAGRRADEIGLRAALGADRPRIVRQLLTESTTLALVGGGLGIALGVAGTRGLLALQPPDAWRIAEVPVDGTVLAVAVLLTLASGLVFGLAPVLHVPRGRWTASARATSGRVGRNASRALVTSEIALSVVLLSGAALTARTFVSLRQVDPGFEIADRTSVSLVLPTRYDSDPSIIALVDAITERFRALPSVRDVGYLSRAPFGGAGTGTHLNVEGREQAERGLYYASRLVGPSWFSTAGIAVLAGRAFEDADAVGEERVALVNRTFARRVFGDEDPVGRRVSTAEAPTEDDWFAVVGVVEDEHQSTLRTPPMPELLMPYRWLPSRRVSFLVHADEGARIEGDALRAAIAQVDPALAPYALQRLEDVYSRVLGPERFLLTLISAFSVLALVLATLGVYGVAAEASQRRTREIGVRLALGAAPGQVARLMLVDGLGLAVCGIAIGVVLVRLGASSMSSVVFGVDPRDTPTLVGAALVMGVVALAASALPVARAARMDPTRAIRSD